MNAGERWMKLFSKTLLILSLAASMTACGAGSEKWKEEVQLSDGRVIVIERELVLESGGDEWASNRSGSKPKENRVKFTHPDHPGEIIEWRTRKLDIQRWPEFPLILDMEHGQLVLFTDVFTSVGCNRYSKYLYQNGAWVEEQLPTRFEAKNTNLFLFRSRDYKEFIDLETKRKNIADVRSKDRRQVGPTNPDCSHL